MRRLLVTVPATTLLVAALAACGSQKKDAEVAVDPDALAGVVVTGEFGEVPEIKVEKFDVDEATDAVVITGDGDKIAADTTLKYHFALFNGSDGELISDSYSQGSEQQMVVSQQFKALADAVTGVPVGSRVVLGMPVAEMLGEADPTDYGMKKDDDLVMVVDLLSEPEPPLDGPEGAAVEAPAGAPAVVEKDGAVTGIDFADADAKPSKDLEVITLIEGEGTEVKEGDTVTVDYYGAVYGADKAFDESYSAEPVSFPLAKGSLIDGWVEGLAGVKAGSRVMLVIPSEKGYGKQGSGEDIPGGSTLVFVIDVLGVNL